MSENRLNAYHIMWLFVFFDLPVVTKKERRTASLFRKNLMKDGFVMLQYSVYIRHCASYESQKVHIKRVKSIVYGQHFKRDGQAVWRHRELLGQGKGEKSSIRTFAVRVFLVILQARNTSKPTS